MPDVHDTLDDVAGEVTARRAGLTRRVLLLAMAAVVGAGATGWLGLRTQRRSSSGGGWTMTLEYPRVARAGLDITWRVSVTGDRPMDSSVPVVLAVTASFFDIFETQGFSPEPDAETRDGRWRYLEFVPVDGAAEFVVDFDTYVQPAAQVGRDAEVRLLVDDVEQTALAWTTTLLP